MNSKNSKDFGKEVLKAFDKAHPEEIKELSKHSKKEIRRMNKVARLWVEALKLISDFEASIFSKLHE